MLVKVENGGVKRFIQVPSIEGKFDFHLFLKEVTNKFSLQKQLETGAELFLTDDTGTEVDEDVFDELLKSGAKDFKADFKFQVLDIHLDIVNDATESSVIEPSRPTAESSPKSPMSPISQLSHPDDLSSM